MAQASLEINISGSPQAIKVIEELLDDPAAYQAIMATIADSTRKAINDTGKLGTKKVEITVQENRLLRRTRRRWLDEALNEGDGSYRP